MIPSLVFLLVWCVSVPVAYMLMRRELKAITGKWKRIDRLVALGLASVSGPFMVFVFIVSAIFDRVSATGWAKQEVKW
jgi:hypothetical protein